MPFTPGSSNVGPAAKQIRKLQKTIANLEGQIRMLQEKNRRLIDENKQLWSIVTEAKFFETQPSDEHEIIGAFLHLLQQNLSREPNGRRYKPLQSFFTLLSFMGPHYFNILTTKLMFPTYRTTQSYKQILYDQLEIHNDLFDGGLPNILAILKECLPGDYHGSLIMMVDAASVTPYVHVLPDGTVWGLTECTYVGPDDAQAMIANSELFNKFIEKHRKQLIKGEFTVMLAPVAEGHRPFPLCCLPEKSGTASYEIVAKVESILQVLRREGYRIAGLATDGDNAYKKYSTILVCEILDNLNAFASKCVSTLFFDQSRILHFSDPFHLAKRDRYRRISGKPFAASPYNMHPQYTARSLKDLGVPSYILADEAARKMEDSLPLQLFCQTVLGAIREQGDCRLFFCMLPTTLLLESIHSEYLTRQERIDNLLLGASFIIIYLSLLRNEASFFESWNASTASRTIDSQCFSSDWCEEYISTTICIAGLLVNEPSVNLGACGTHFLEHLFGSVRRLSRGDDTHMRFIGALKNTYLERHLLKDLEIPPINTQRRSDSGRTVSDDFEVQEFLLAGYLHAAKCFMNNFIDFPAKLPVSFFAPADEIMSLDQLCELIKLTPKSGRFAISTKSECMTSTGGLSNCRRWKAAGQLGHIRPDEE